MKLNFYPQETDGFLRWFNRIIERKPSEFLISDTTRFDSCLKFINPEADCDCGIPPQLGDHYDGKVFWCDLEFYFPCDDPDHVDCGFFRWVLTVETFQHRLAINQELQEAGETAWDRRLFDKIVLEPTITEDNLKKYTKEWLEEWVVEVSDLPIRYIPFEERRQRFAKYEEYHPGSMEATDFIAVCERRVIELQNSPESSHTFDSAEDFLEWLHRLDQEGDF